MSEPVLEALCVRRFEDATHAEGHMRVTGILEYRDAEGRVLKQVPFSTHLPLFEAAPETGE